MLVARRFVQGMVDGAITQTYRRWKRPQVVAGRPYRTLAGRLEVDAVEEVAPTSITEADAVAAGFDSVAALMAALPTDRDDQPLFRIRFHMLDEPDPRSTLAATEELDADDVAALDRRLDRFDRARVDVRPWTAETLAIIAEHPARRAGDLAAMLGRELAPFKLDVRKLKALGLTESLVVGYRLSPRGERYRALSRRHPSTPASRATRG